MLVSLKKELVKIGIEMLGSKVEIMTSFNGITIDFIDVVGLLFEVLLDGKARMYLGRMLSCPEARANRIKAA